MNLKQIAFGYHPDTEAIAVCERCRRPICLSDKRIFRKSHSSWGNNGDTYYTSHDYCIICNSAQLSSQAKYSLLILFCVGPFILFFILTFISMWTSTPSSNDGIFTLMPIFFIGIPLLMLGGIIYTIIKAKNMATAAETEALNFKSSLGSNILPFTYQKFNGSSFDTPQKSNAFSFDSPSTSKSFFLVCFECGTKITIEDKFCPNCGDATKDELEKHYSQ
jgi:hypothetical protein